MILKMFIFGFVTLTFYLIIDIANINILVEDLTSRKLNLNIKM